MGVMPRRKRLPVAFFLLWLTAVSAWVVSGLSEPGSVLAKTAKSTVAKHIKIGDTECTACHEEKLENKVVHPVAEDCTSCHQYSEQKDKEEAEMKLMAEGNELCMMCHTDKQEDLEGKKFKHEAAEADCTFCHNPHSTAEPVLLKEKVNSLCFTCHTDQEEELTSKKFAHAPAKDLGCNVCHDPHASDLTTLLKAAGNDLCLACHKYSPRRKKGKAGKIILTQRSVPEGYADKARKVILGKNGKGHPYIGHPVGGVPDPSRPNEKLSCLSCHNPHAGKVRQMFQGDLGKQQLCDKCHK